MSNPAPICTHVKTNGIRCGSPAVSGTDVCHHHSAIKTATSHTPKVRPGSGEFAPIPFVFPEDRASMQINFFLLLQAFNQHQIDLRTFKSMMSMLKAMNANLGKTGSLIDEPADEKAEASAHKSQKNSKRREEDFEEEADDPFADLRHLPKDQFNAAVRARAAAPQVSTPREDMQ